MRVCYFVPEYPAPSHTFVRREIVELERNGISVLRVSLRGGGLQLVDPADLSERDRTRYILDGNIAKFGAALARAMLHRPMALAKATAAAFGMMRRSSRPAPLHLAYLAEALVLARWVLEEDVQHIHAHFGTNGAEVAMLCHLMTGVPYSFTVHGPDEFDRPEYLGLPAKVKHAAFVCVISSFTGSQLCRWIPQDEWRKLKLVRCGLDADFLAVRPSRLVQKARLVTVGRLSEQKGHMVLLQALATLARAGVPFKLTVVGDGPLRSQLEQRIRQLGLEQQVELVGWMSNAEVRAAIGEARALVLPSFAEGLPVVLMEALALGRPVVTTYIAGIPELVEDKTCGWLVPAGSVDQLADAIRQCLDAPDTLIRTMGSAGRKRVLEQHDIVPEARTLAALFRAQAQEAAPPRDRVEAAGRRAEAPEASNASLAERGGSEPGKVIALRPGHAAR
ncbi:MAG TPA: glycosyltransferase [Bosea sp. (in: a-proteobacteria)]|jgi:glycosyltransferase involved in cell wall biosynthesis|uniref:glycosyltransferase n=1 Tax=Bosea sp. (in: a-proteobacteria) TaxID=1871050 RepID=UPI002E126BE9|nr:glycosyltransferase [Bosea sp. (in: a-proteobacteria)]